jgi:predicted metalloprotease with PDZ domain
MVFLNTVVAVMLTGSILHSKEPGMIGINWGVYSHKINHIFQGSPAHLAGLKRGDVIVHAVEDDKNAPHAGTTVELDIKRAGQILHFIITRVPASTIVHKWAKDAE